MAGWDDSIFGNLPGAPPRPQPPPARGLRKELAPVNPSEVIGGAAPYLQRFNQNIAQGMLHPLTAISNAQDLGSNLAGQGVAWGAGKMGLPNPDLLGRDVTAWLQKPGEGSIKPSHAIEAAPLAIPAAKAIASGAEDAAQAAKPPIIAYHGSPYSFDRFDPSKIGTGEGATAYGEGFYFAENEGVAKSYRDQLASRDIQWPTKASAALYNQLPDAHQRIVKGWLDQPGMTGPQFTQKLNDLADSAQRNYDYQQSSGRKSGAYYGDDGGAQMAQTLQQLAQTKRKPTLDQGHMYQVGINAQPEKFLDWDKSFGEQDPLVQDAISNAMFKHDVSGPGGRPADEWLQQTQPSGADILNRLGSNTVGGGEPRLQEAGVPGIRYLDQGSRTAGQGTSNYVVFDPDTVNILKRYGLAGMLAPVGAGAATLSVLGQPGSGVTLNNTQPPPDQQPPQFY